MFHFTEVYADNKLCMQIVLQGFNSVSHTHTPAHTRYGFNINAEMVYIETCSHNSLTAVMFLVWKHIWVTVNRLNFLISIIFLVPSYITMPPKVQSCLGINHLSQDEHLCRDLTRAFVAR